MTTRIAGITDSQWETLVGIFAYDMGAVDSGIRNEPARAGLIGLLTSMSEEAFRLEISRRMRDEFLSEEALAQRYGIEDVASFIRWLDERMECSL